MKLIFSSYYKLGLLMLIFLADCTNNYNLKNISNTYDNNQINSQMLLEQTTVNNPTVKISNYWVVSKQPDDIVYISSFPISSSGSIRGRGLHYIMLSYDTKNSILTLSIVGGKPFGAFSPAILKVNYNDYYFSLYQNRAWLVNQPEITQLIQDLKQSKELTVINNFSDNTQAIDTYSLDGFINAYTTATNPSTIVNSQ